MQRDPVHQWSESISDRLQDIVTFEAGPSRSRTGTGSRREGEKFEGIVRRLWEELAQNHPVDLTCRHETAPSGAGFYTLSKESRKLYLPASTPGTDHIDVPESWTATKFSVEDLVDSFPGTDVVVSRYAPEDSTESSEFFGNRYPGIYSGKTTEFDDTIVLVQDGIIKEKILLEYKTGKSSRRTNIDGNAHERLSFQILQYLEVAQRYPRCSLSVCVNSAFVRYKNKYHVNFHIQGERLEVYDIFRMRYMATAREYLEFVSQLLAFLLHGTDMPRWAGASPVVRG